MTAHRTMVHVLHERASQLGDRPALWTKREGTYVPTSWRQYAQRVKQLALALHELGFGPGDALAIMSFNREEWLVADLAAMALGGTAVGVYTTSSPEQIQYIVGHCAAKVFLVEGAAYLRTALALRPSLPALAHVVVMDPPSPLPADVKTYAELLARGQGTDEAVYHERVDALKPDGMATLIYTSGTTGNPKGVMLSHHNLTWTTEKLIQCTGLSDRELIVSYLPLSHIAEQICSLHGPLWKGIQVYFAESFEKLGQNLREAQPTVFFGVPRVWEKFMARAEDAFAKLPGARRKLLEWARAVTSRRHALALHNEPVPVTLELRYQLAQRLVLRSLKARIGFGRTRFYATAAAPIGRNVLEFFASIDVIVRETYGQSEGTGPTTVSVEGATRLGLVGQPMPGVAVKIADDGEILVKGGNVCLGYYKDPAATADLLEGGWLHSGDVGELDAEGYLRITGRKKEIIVTSGGKKTAPANIEELLKSIRPVGQAVVIGDRRNYLVALLTLDPDKAPSFAREHGLPADAKAMAVDARFNAYLHEQIEQVVNPKVARFETIKKFAVLTEDFTIESDELTPSLKVKRRIVEAKRRAVIESLYAGHEAAAAG
jgi:long-chain acyl-CoA synthetase